HTTRDQLHSQEAVGDIERVVLVAVGVVDLHAALVEVLYEADAALPLYVLLTLGLARLWPPEITASNYARRDGLICALPRSLESEVGKCGGVRLERLPKD